ncbi:MAG: HAD family hydrolase [Acidobacteriaceae bacterium]
MRNTADHNRTPLPLPAGQTLLIDADDTLWENYIYFEQTINAFIRYLDHPQHTHDEVRTFLNGIERESIQEHGYGLHSFRRSLLRCFASLSPGPVTPEHHQQIVDLTHAIAGHPIQLLPGVATTLPQLAARHRLILMTKGNLEEQTGKVERSGLRQHFTAVEVPAEKDPPAYRAVLEKYSLEAAATWMIGNSPKSDINPALDAGLHAVLVTHPHTWVLEHEELRPAPPGQHFLQCATFAGLTPIFCCPEWTTDTRLQNGAKG